MCGFNLAACDVEMLAKQSKCIQLHAALHLTDEMCLLCLLCSRQLYDDASVVLVVQYAKVTPGRVGSCCLLAGQDQS